MFSKEGQIKMALCPKLFIFFTLFSWWKDKSLCIGKLTVKVRRIKIVNMLTAHEDILEVRNMT